MVSFKREFTRSMIFKRFNDTLKLSNEELHDIDSIMPKEKVPFYNSIDMGIFLYFLQVSLFYNNISFQRSLCKEEDKSDLIPVAIYNLL